MFASIFDQLINTAIILDMIFNTEMIVKDMKGGKEDMTEKRFVYYEHKGADYILDNPNESLDFIEMLGDCLEAEEIVDLLNCLNDENEQLKQELIELKKWEKYVGDVKREDLDKVFKMSIYEIAEAFAYYEKRIRELEE